MFLVAVLVAAACTAGYGGVASTPVNSLVQQGTAQLTITPNSVSLNNTVGTSGSMQSVTATNSGTAALDLNQVSIAGAGLTMSGLTLPCSLSPGQSKNFTVMFGATPPALLVAPTSSRLLASHLQQGSTAHSLSSSSSCLVGLRARPPR